MLLTKNFTKVKMIKIVKNDQKHKIKMYKSDFYKI